MRDTTELRNKYARFKTMSSSNIPWDYTYTDDKKNNKNERLKDMVNCLVRGAIQVNDFESFLRDRKINPNVESISKHLRNAKYSRINHKELMCSILNYQDV
jgi:hypothetical protein